MATVRNGVTSRHEVFQILRDKILYLEMKPGELVNESQISEELGISRTPIREAIILLEREQLIDIYPQRGTFVSLIDLGLIRESAYMRHILEVNILCDLAGKKPQISPQAEEALMLQGLAVKNRQPKEYVQNDHRFHAALYKQADHGGIWDLLERQYLHTIRYNMLDFSFSKQLEESHQEHTQIIQFITAGNIPKLLAILEIHHDAGLRFAEKYQSENLDYFL